MWIQKTVAGVASLAFSPDARTLYVLDTRGHIIAWDVAARTKQPVARVSGGACHPETRLWAACDGRFLVARLRHEIHILETATGAQHAKLPIEPNSFGSALDPTGRLIVALDSQRQELTAWDIEKRTLAQPLLRAERASKDRFGEFALSPDGKLIATCTAQREIAVYDHDTHRAFARIDPDDNISAPNGLVFSPDGKTLGVMNPSRCALCDISSGRFRPEVIHCFWPERVSAVHPTQPIFMARDRNALVTLFSFETGESIRTLDFAVGSSFVSCVAVSPDGLLGAIGGTNKQFAVFDVDV